ncbi:hypothetical protein V1478_008836 [Vespula squamosa]|uniref:Uncharacterized protein n=1 Tax=Vespula squamosa TaxID=30214 RepID=A0ABD2AUM0_VESSQ
MYKARHYGNEFPPTPQPLFLRRLLIATLEKVCHGNPCRRLSKLNFSEYEHLIPAYYAKSRIVALRIELYRPKFARLAFQKTTLKI